MTRPDLTVKAWVRAELGARGWTNGELASRLKTRRSSAVNAYLRDDGPDLPADVLEEIVTVFRHAGGFCLPDAAQVVGVIPMAMTALGASRARSGRTSGDQELPFLRIGIDTIAVDIDPLDPGDHDAHDAINSSMSSHEGIPLKRHQRAAWGQGVASDDGVIVKWRPYDSSGKQAAARVEFGLAPTTGALRAPESVTALVRPLVAHPALRVSVSRIDVAVDYPVSIHFLMLSRPVSKITRAVENTDGAVTYYVGRRGSGSNVLVRMYDWRLRHPEGDVPSTVDGGPWEGPITRIEAEHRPKRGQLNVFKLESMRNPFDRIDLLNTPAPDLSFDELQALWAHRALGRSTCRRLMSADQFQVLRRAIKKCREAPILVQPRTRFVEAWQGVVEWFQVQLHR